MRLTIAPDIEVDWIRLKKQKQTLQGVLKKYNELTWGERNYIWETISLIDDIQCSLVKQHGYDHDRVFGEGKTSLFSKTVQ